MTLQVHAVEGIGEIRPEHDLAALVLDHAELRDGDVVVVTSKVVSKSLGLATRADRDTVIAEQTDRVVAERGPTRIVRTWDGLTLAAAGVDTSNVEPGTALPLPPRPDEQASRIRAGLLRSGVDRIAVVISDTAGRAWRNGQTDIAIGCAGLAPFESFAGRLDAHGNPLAVTAPAVADEVAGAAELASGKLGGRPVVVVRGLPSHLLLEDDGPGAAALVRDEQGDLFGLGSREAVLAATSGVGTARGFPHDPGVTAAQIVGLARPGLLEVRIEGDVVVIASANAHAVEAGALRQRIASLAVAHGLALTVSVALQ